MNKVFLVGNLTADPIAKQTSTGKALTNLTIACNDNTQGREHTNFFNCVAWNSTATYIATYIKKGDCVVIDGKLNRRSYVNKDGKNIYVTEIVIDAIKLVIKRTKQTQQDGQKTELASVNDNFATMGVNTDANFTKNDEQPIKQEDKPGELDWINEESK